MFKKTLTSDFFTTINFNLFFESFKSITLLLPSLRKGNSNLILENEIKSYLWLEKSEIISLYSWRSAIFQALKIIWINKKDEVIINWYTCVSVSNAVIQTWAKPIYSDINKKNYSFDIKKLEEKITKNTKVIIVQHTFWKNWNIKQILKIAKKYWILIIEDCAHSLWTKIEKKHLWTFWDFTILSTWRDKVISTVNWWFLLINNKDYFKEIKKIKEKLINLPILITLKNHFYNIFAFIAYKTYDFLYIWNFLMLLSKKIKLFPYILTKEEKECNFIKFYYKLPNSLARIWIKELQKIKKYNNHRRSIAEYYNELIKNKKVKIWFTKLKNEKNNYFRYPILLKDIKQTWKLL